MLRPAIEGGFASCNPRTQVLTGSGGLQASDPDGLEVSVFGWADLITGRVANERTNPQQRIGFVLPILGDGRLLRIARGQRWIRPGLPVTLCVRGEFYVRFAGGAIKSQPVYASLVDGSAISGYAADAELTPWSVLTTCEPGGLAIISTWSKFS